MSFIDTLVWKTSVISFVTSLKDKFIQRDVIMGNEFDQERICDVINVLLLEHDPYLPSWGQNNEVFVQQH